jgi:hypothetical protein
LRRRRKPFRSKGRQRAEPVGLRHIAQQPPD